MKKQLIIRNLLQKTFEPSILVIEDESHLHSGPFRESHFKVSITSLAFEGLSTLKRHKLIYKALGNIFQEIHALSILALAPSEPSKEHQTPSCQKRVDKDRA